MSEGELYLFDLEAYCGGRYSQPVKGCSKSLADCVAGLSLADLSGYTKQEFVQLVKDDDGPWKTVPSWLVARVEGLPDGKQSLESFLRPETTISQQQTPVATQTSVVKAEPEEEQEEKPDTYVFPSSVAPSSPPAPVAAHRRRSITSPASAAATGSNSPSGAPVVLGSRRSPSPTRSDSNSNLPKTTGVQQPSAPPARPIIPPPSNVPPTQATQRTPSPRKKDNKDKNYHDRVQSMVLKIFQTCVVGGGAVGKSAFTIRYLQDYFVEIYDPTVEDSYRKQVNFELPNGEEVPIVLDILDTAGQDEYSAMRDHYMHQGDGFLLLYDITSRHTFDETREFREQICRAKDFDSVPLVLVGNKADLTDDREVPYAEGRALASSWGVPFFETSARTGTNVGAAWQQLLLEIYKQRLKEAESKIERQSTGSKCVVL